LGCSGRVARVPAVVAGREGLDCGRRDRRCETVGIRGGRGTGGEREEQRSGSQQAYGDPTHHPRPPMTRPTPTPPKTAPTVTTSVARLSSIICPTESGRT